MTPIETGVDACIEYTTRPNKSCNCDFHSCKWTTNGVFVSVLGVPLYAKPGDPLVKVNGSYCNHPSSVVPTGLRVWLPADTIKFGVNREHIATNAVITKTGYKCSECNEYNDYAAANQANGTYLCYRCRV